MRSVVHAALPLPFDLMAATAGPEVSYKGVDAFKKRHAGWARRDCDRIVVELAREIARYDFDFAEPWARRIGASPMVDRQIHAEAVDLSFGKAIVDAALIGIGDEIGERNFSPGLVLVGGPANAVCIQDFECAGVIDDAEDFSVEIA